MILETTIYKQTRISVFETIIVCKLFVVDKNTWYHITVGKQMIIIDK